MPRPKGSLNKATLEKMKQQEEFEKFMMMKKQMDSNENNEDNEEIEQKPFKISSISEKASSLASNESSIEMPKKHRGRPRKNPLPEESENSENIEDVTTSAQPINIPTKISQKILDSLPDDPAKKKKESKKNSDNKDKYQHCDRCHMIIMSTGNRVDTNTASGKPDYYRNLPRIVYLCDECAKQLSEVIDNWLYENGDGVQPKPYCSFGSKEEANEEDEEGNDIPPVNPLNEIDEDL